MLALLRANWLHIGIGLAVLAALWFVHHDGYKRAEDHYRIEDAKRAEMERRLADKIHNELSSGLAGLDRSNREALASIDRTDRTVVQPIITREVSHDPRYSSPDCSVSGGVFGAINAARAASGDSSAQR